MECTGSFQGDHSPPSPKGHREKQSFGARKAPSYQSADHNNFFKMEAWILGFSCLQGLNQISNVIGSLQGQNTTAEAMGPRGVGQRFSTLAARHHQLGNLTNTHP